MIEAALLTTAVLFGGMLLFSGGFAAFLFKNLPAEKAGHLLRRAFPPFYLFVIGAASLAAGLAWLGGAGGAIVAALAAIALSTVPARQVLMPAINAASDAGDTARFHRLHGASVALTLGHIALSGWVVVAL